MMFLYCLCYNPITCFRRLWNLFILLFYKPLTTTFYLFSAISCLSLLNKNILSILVNSFFNPVNLFHLRNLRSYVFANICEKIFFSYHRQECLCHPKVASASLLTVLMLSGAGMLPPLFVLFLILSWDCEDFRSKPA